jgi:hypothetical protein
VHEEDSAGLHAQVVQLPDEQIVADAVQIHFLCLTMFILVSIILQRTLFLQYETPAVHGRNGLEGIGHERLPRVALMSL